MDNRLHTLKNSKEVVMKFCNKCSSKKPIDLFYKNKSAKDGLSFYCKCCSNSYVRSYEKRNPEKVKKFNKIKCRNYVLNNKESIKEKNRKWYVKNRDKILNSNRYICHVSFKKSGFESIVPNEFIEAKRLNLKLTREIRK